MMGTRGMGIALGMVAVLSAQGVDVVDLGTIQVPQPWEKEGQQNGAGTHHVTLFRERLGVAWKKREGGVRGTYLDTTVRPLGKGEDGTRLGTRMVHEQGQSWLEIRAVHQGRVFTARLRCVEQVADAPFVGNLAPVVQREVALLRKVHELVRTHGPAIWPGWTGCEGADLRVQFPSGLKVLLTAQAPVWKPFERTALALIEGKALYLDRSGAEAGPVGALGGMRGETDSIGVQAWLQAAGPGASPADLRNAEVVRLMTYVHEVFHHHQRRVQAKASDSGTPPLESPRRGTERSKAFLSEEVRALLAADRERDPAKALHHVQRALVARELKQEAWPGEGRRQDEWLTTYEGSATFAAIRMAERLHSAGKEALGEGFEGLYPHLEKYLEAERVSRLEGDLGLHEQAYGVGARWFACLDRFSPGSKTGVFGAEKRLEAALGVMVHLDVATRERLRKEILEAVATRLRAAEVATVGKAQEGTEVRTFQTVAKAFAQQKGLQFLVYLLKAGEGQVIVPNAEILQSGSTRLFPKGIRRYAWKGFLLSTEDQIVMVNGYPTISWIDTQVQPGARGYELTYGSKDGEVYRDVTVKGRGFTLRAKALRIPETDEVAAFYVME